MHPYATFVVRSGRGAEMGFPSGMDPIPAGELGDPQLAAILDWLSAPARPTTGDGLYTRYCGNCHGADAWGGRVGKGLTHESEENELLEAVREGHGGGRFGDREEYMPAWPAAELTDLEIAAIASYVGALPPNPDDDDDD